MSLLTDFTKGIWKENPVLVLLLGTCPTLAVTSSARVESRPPESPTVAL